MSFATSIWRSWNRLTRGLAPRGLIEREIGLTLDFDKFLRWEETSYDTIKVKRMYVDIAGDLVAGILLSQIIYWHLPNRQNGTSKLRVKKGEHLWLAKGRDDWWDECRITARQFDRAINILVDKDVIEKKIFRFNGSPMVHVRLKPEILMKHINAEIDNKQREMDFNESVKSNLTKGENPSLRKCKIQIDKSVKSLTETTTDTTSKTTTDITTLSSDDDTTTPYKKIVESYNDICKSLPSVRIISDKRKKKMRVTAKEFGLEDFIDVFRKAENSEFLSGKNGRWNGCNFDWLINYNNFIKVIEGTYSNRNGPVDGPNDYGW